MSAGRLAAADANVYAQGTLSRGSDRSVYSIDYRGVTGKSLQVVLFLLRIEQLQHPECSSGQCAFPHLFSCTATSATGGRMQRSRDARSSPSRLTLGVQRLTAPLVFTRGRADRPSTLLQPHRTGTAVHSTSPVRGMPLLTSSPRLSSFRKQHLLIEFSTLQHAQLDGVFVSITPGDPSLWVAVIFVRKGPYAPAVLRFQISFPSNYPALPPLVTISTDVFHSLLTPLTTYTHTTASSDTDTVSATDDERLPPGGFSLRHGFPHWFGRARRSIVSSRDVSGSAIDSPAQSVTPVRSAIENPTSGGSGSSPPATVVSIVTILDYIRSTFSEEAVLDSISLEAAANPGAYHAWRAYRGSALSAQQPLSPVSIHSVEGSTLGRNRRPGEWNWDGVWEERVKRAVNASLSESVLYGPATGDDIIRFQQVDTETTTKMKKYLNVSTAGTAEA